MKGLIKGEGSRSKREKLDEILDEEMKEQI